jgi:pimeloyl-ACP methyl ester carboxylesterase
MTSVSDHPQQQNHPDQSAAGRPTIVLVHGAFADSSSWVAVDRALAAKGYTAVPVANPLRDLDGDAAYTASVAATIDGPVVLVGHSYAGAVITQALRRWRTWSAWSTSPRSSPRSARQRTI